jgi:hypothetical protein
MTSTDSLGEEYRAAAPAKRRRRTVSPTPPGAPAATATITDADLQAIVDHVVRITERIERLCRELEAAQQRNAGLTQRVARLAARASA